jgi:prepilin-type processing-associated H-X9-DG protein
MKQLALAAHNYLDANQSLPAGYDWSYLTGPLAGYIGTGKGIFPPLLPYLEGRALFNAINFDVNIFYLENVTIHAIGTSSLWCPSDPTAADIKNVDPNSSFYFPVPPPMVARMAYTSYAGMCGPWTNNTYSLGAFGGYPAREYPQAGAVVDNEKGVFGCISKVRLADIPDGTSNTIMFGEHTHAALAPSDRINWHWWASGNNGDTLITAMYPINPQQKMKDAAASEPWLNASTFIISASSQHPGGANFAFADGSVRFLKDTVDTWPIDPTTSLPVGVTQTVLGASATWSTVFNINPLARVGTYQKISTRNGNEAVSSDAY